MPTIILFAPLIGALICGFGWRLMGEKPAMMVATGLLFLSCVLSWVVFLTFSANGGGGAEHAFGVHVAVAGSRPAQRHAADDPGAGVDRVTLRSPIGDPFGQRFGRRRPGSGRVGSPIGIGGVRFGHAFARFGAGRETTRPLPNGERGPILSEQSVGERVTRTNRHAPPLAARGASRGRVSLCTPHNLGLRLGLPVNRSARLPRQERFGEGGGELLDGGGKGLAGGGEVGDVRGVQRVRIAAG